VQLQRFSSCGKDQTTTIDSNGASSWLGGLDAAQALLGHKTLSMTEHYAKLNVEDVVRVAAQLG
jgi:integrase